jgi:hypothetical protein
VTYPFLTNYERTKIVSFRASQISNGAKPYILVPEGVTDSYVIATMELEAVADEKNGWTRYNVDTHSDSEDAAPANALGTKRKYTRRTEVVEGETEGV